MKTNDEHKITIELFEGNSVKISVAGDADLLANMVYSSMLQNPFFAAVVMTCAQTYQKQLEDNSKALLN